MVCEISDVSIFSYNPEYPDHQFRAEGTCGCQRNFIKIAARVRLDVGYVEDKLLRVGFNFFFHFKADIFAIIGANIGNVEFIDSWRCNGNIRLNRDTGLADQACDLWAHIGR